jgi:glycosyltransferase involved in cell wall biosynthesis
VPRLLYLVNRFSVGGTEVLALELFRRLHPARFEVEVICLKEPGTLAGELARAGIRVESGVLRSRFDLLGPGRLARALRGRRFDLMLVDSGRNALLLSAFARRLVRARAVLSWVHFTGKWGKAAQFNGTERRLLRRLDAVVAVAETQKRHLVEREGLDARNVVVIHNGVDVERYAPRPERREAARAALGVAPGEVAAGIVASLTPEKGHRVLIDAAARAAGAGVPLRLLIAGDGPERGAIEQAIAASGAGDRVTLLGLRRDLDRDLYPALDVALLASLPARETLPISLMEAMASGLPVIATRVGSIADLVEDGRTGLLVPPDDPAALAAALAALARDPARRAAMGAAGRARVVERFSLPRMVEDYARLFTTLLESRGAQGAA